MNLEDLIKDDRLEVFDASLWQAMKQFKSGEERLNIAKQLMLGDLENIEYRKMLYENIYNASRFVSTAFLFLEGYRAKHKLHHQTVLVATGIILNNSHRLDRDTKDVMDSLYKLKKRRNDIDYEIDPPDISRSGLDNAIKIVERWIKKVRSFIEEKQKIDNLI